MIEVVIPVRSRGSEGASPHAHRAPAALLGPDATIGLVDNGKYLARDVLVAIADRIIASNLRESYQVHTKPSASATISESGRAELLARSRMIITGVGD